MNIAIFADVHGRILLAFQLCARWQQETGETIDLILQAGDMGTYPDPTRLDSATIKHARKDPSELGFSEYFVKQHPDAEAILTQTTAPMIFVRGNHEDHPWLDELEKSAESAIFPIDVYERIYCLRTGHLYTHKTSSAEITIVGIGRIGPLPGDSGINKAKYIQPYEIEAIYDTKMTFFDLLLTHDTAQDFITFGYGMEEIRLVLDTFHDSRHPAYHFHGHTEEAYIERLDKNNITRVIKLTDLRWDTSQPHLPLETGAIGILRWKSEFDHQFDIVDADWFTEFNAKNWLTL